MPSRFLNNIRINDEYTLPSADGTVDQIITTDGAGQLSFVDLSSIDGASSNFVYFEVKNETGSTINKGKGVMAVGTDGNSGHILIDEMVADGTVEPKYFLGVLETTVANGGFARVISFGQLSQFNTNGQNGETWNDGQILWCDPANPGDFTITEPNGPNVKIAAAFILNSSTNGKIQVRVQANEGIHDLHDTKITSQVDGDVLVWDNTTGVWFNDSTLNVDYTNGRVGIGTDSPGATLQVYNSTEGQYMEIGAGDGGGRSLVFTSSNNNGSVGALHTINAKSINGTIALATANSERMRITSAGNVGIGTTSPVVRLDYGASLNQAFHLYTSGVDYYGINMTQYDSGTYSTNIFSGNGGQIKFRTATGTSTQSTRMTIAAGGNVGIGTTSPTTAKLVVDTSSAIAASFGRDGTDGDVVQVYNGASGTTKVLALGASGNDGTIYSQFGDLILQQSAGNVGIGTTSPGEKLEVNGNIKADSFIKDGGTSNQFLKADGSVDTISYASTDNTYNKAESDSIFTSKTLSQNISFGESYASNYRSRVLDYGGTFFPRPLGYEIGLMKEQELFQKASLSLLPSGVGTGKVHNIKPKNDTFDFTRASTATYVDEDGFIAIAPSNTPRLDYPIVNGAVQATPSLLLEPARTNLVTYSESFDNAYWTKTNVSVVSGFSSPDGATNAYKLISNNGGNIIARPTITQNTTHSTSFYLKRVSGTGNVSIFKTNGDEEIVTLTDEWQRFTNINSVNPSTAYIGVRLYGLNDEVLVYGAQLEQGSYATSYIPTQGATATRVAETCSGAGNNQVINSTEGVLYYEVSAQDNSITTSILSISSGSNANTLYSGFSSSSNTIQAQLVVGGVTQTNMSYVVSDRTKFNKVAILYQNNNHKMYVNGVEAVVDTSGSVPSANTFDRLNFDLGQGSFDFYGNVKEIKLYNTALTDQELINLTTI